jgi:hypothetical protein
MKQKGFLVQIHHNQCLLCFQERILEQVMCTRVGVLIERRKPHWCPSCTHDPNLATVDCRMPMTPVPFYQYPHTDAPSSSSSLSYSFFFNIKLSTIKIYTFLDLTIRHPWSHISLWIDSPMYTISFSTFYLEMYQRLSSIFNQFPPLWLKLFILWNVHFWLMIWIIWHY